MNTFNLYSKITLAKIQINMVVSGVMVKVTNSRGGLDWGRVNELLLGKIHGDRMVSKLSDDTVDLCILISG